MSYQLDTTLTEVKQSSPSLTKLATENAPIMVINLQVHGCTGHEMAHADDLYV